MLGGEHAHQAHCTVTNDSDRLARFDIGGELATPHGVMVTGFRDSTLKKFEGMRLDEIAKAMNADWSDALIDLTLRENARLGGIFFLASDENLLVDFDRSVAAVAEFLGFDR